MPAFGLVAVAAVGSGLAIGVLGESDAERTARRFGAAWEARDHAAMHALLSDGAKERVSAAELARAYDDARLTATIVRLRTGNPAEDGDVVRLPVAARTRIFGTLRGEVALPIEDGLVDWAPHLVLPGMPSGSRLGRRTEAPARADILARDGTPLAAGPPGARSSPLGEPATHAAGELGAPQDDEEARALRARGFPEGTLVGRSGLERILERRLAGTPGGTLLAGERVLARSEPLAADDVRTTIDPEAQVAAVQALAGRFGGIAALDAGSAEVRALAGIAFSAPQPPGSTFKIVTATAALEAGIVEASTEFPVETHATIDGVELENAHREACGGTFANSFAHSCNSVFAPLGVEIGAERLVEMAERYGFNEEPKLAGAASSTIPAAAEIASPLELGATAIGQGRVLATPLRLASIAQTVASEGVRRRPSVLPDGGGEPVRVTSREVARTLERLMVGVVRYGTGTAASLAPATTVAGKTGTAELEDTTDDEDDPEEAAEPPGFDTDAWLTAYAPARDPQIAVAVLLVRRGAGGDTAAPAARQVLQAGLR